MCFEESGLMRAMPHVLLIIPPMREPRAMNDVYV
jgi:hypothetical protein